MDRIQVGKPYRCRGLVVFPLALAEVRDRSDYLCLDEAIRRGELEITEYGRGVVSKLLVENFSGAYVFLLGGEILSGGKQNRILREDVLLPPRSGRVVVPVYCIEQDRWTAPRGAFAPEGSIPHSALRKKAARGSAQEEVWREAAKKARELDAGSRTKDYGEIYRKAEVRKGLESYRRAIRRIRLPRTVGMVVARGTRILGCDAFCNPGLFSKLGEKIIDSYALDDLRYRSWKSAGDLERCHIERWLGEVRRARITWRTTPSMGRGFEVTGTGLSGSGLLFRSEVIHMYLYPGR